MVEFGTVAAGTAPAALQLDLSSPVSAAILLLLPPAYLPLESGLVFSDVHRPFHDQRAWKLLLKVGQALKPTHLVSLGDYADCYSISAHSKDPARASRLIAEVADLNAGLDELDDLGARTKVFVSGNHCDRLRRYLSDRAPALFGMVEIPQVLRLKERGWTYVPYKDSSTLGKVHLTHDQGYCGRYVAHRVLDSVQHSVLSGHAHRLSYVVEGNASGEHRVSACFGWLGDVEQVDYMHRLKARRDWPLGFGVFHLDPRSGVMYVVPVPIVKVGRRYTACVNGELHAV